MARCTVEHLMRLMSLRGVVRSRNAITTMPEHGRSRPPDLVDRRLKALRPNDPCDAAFTYLASWSGLVYFVCVVNVSGRHIVGWRASTSMRTDPVLDALERALWPRPCSPKLIHHSGRGSQAGFNRSLQHLNAGEGCDNEATTVGSTRPWATSATPTTAPCWRPSLTSRHTSTRTPLAQVKIGPTPG